MDGLTKKMERENTRQEHNKELEDKFHKVRDRLVTAGSDGRCALH